MDLSAGTIHFLLLSSKRKWWHHSSPQCTKKQGMAISAEARGPLFLQLLVEAKFQILKHSSEKAHLRRAELTWCPHGVSWCCYETAALWEPGIVGDWLALQIVFLKGGLWLLAHILRVVYRHCSYDRSDVLSGKQRILSWILTRKGAFSPSTLAPTGKTCISLNGNLFICLISQIGTLGDTNSKFCMTEKNNFGLQNEGQGLSGG